jgi:GNAT superfamily N-acetyltransferase
VTSIRAASPDDVGALATIHAAAVTLAFAGIFDAGLPPPSPDQLVGRWAVLLAIPRSWVGILEAGDEPAGTIGVRPSPDADAGPATGDLFGLHVHPSRWGQGLGRQLLERADAEADAAGFDELRLWVLEANLRARRMYGRRGWEPDGATQLVAGEARELRYRRAPLA